MIRVDFTVPAEFEDVPIGVDFAEAWAEVNTRNAQLSLAATETDQQSLTEMARNLHQISRLLAKAGVVYAANCLHSFQGAPSLGTLAVAVVDFPYGDDARTAAQGTLRAVLDSRGEGWVGGVIDAPCGRVAVFTGGQKYTLPPAFSLNGEPVDVVTAQFHAIVPVPTEVSRDSRYLCLLAFSTPNIGHWETCYAPMMAGVLRSLRFAGFEESGHGPVK
ncbi:hypothetical protein ACIQNU_05240 [Streptomyces sp. NPDC091292]|uniref:hypothetical protein n=1 Tax=Streptomyces sp. NPDC091292 TaxID=3365991 RepID=UPI003801A560